MRLAMNSHVFACATGAIFRRSRATSGRRMDRFGETDSYGPTDGAVVDTMDMVPKDAEKWSYAIGMDMSYEDLVKRKT